jgi:hypothetical protein
MLFGPIPPRKLPPQDAQKVIFHLDRWVRAAEAHAKWATVAKECYDFLESRQVKEEIRAALEARRQPSYTFNKIGRLVRLVLGFFANNRTDLQFMPSLDDMGSQQVAEAISQIWKTVSKMGSNAFVDTEVIMDGIVTGRGWFDSRLDFTDNDLGEIAMNSKDPFSIYVDPDLTEYDVNKGSFVFESRWVSLAEVRYGYGPEAENLVGNLFRTDGYSSFPSSYVNIPSEDIRPVTGFGFDEGGYDERRSVMQAFHEFVDPYRRNVRLLDTQYKVTENCEVFIDLETGDRKIIPDEATVAKLTDGVQTRSEWIDKCVYFAERLGNPLRVAERPMTRIGWSTFIGDVMVFDGFSPYDSYTLNGYFPYFRRGQTRGMVADLIDPQKEYNKRRNAEILGLTRLANGGWFYEQGSLDPIQERNLKKYGSQPGVTIEYKAGKNAPTAIEAKGANEGQIRARETAGEEIPDIAGVNESAMGDLDKVQSGRAIEARQRQAVIAIQLYSTNWSRTAALLGGKFLQLVQKHYTEERVFRILGEDGRHARLVINQSMTDPLGKTIRDRLNDVTLGKYTVTVEETPMAKTFQNAQYEEALGLLKEMGGMAPEVLPAVIDIIIDMSSLPRKEEFKERLAQLGLGGGAGAVPQMPTITDQTKALSLDEGMEPGGVPVQVPPMQ